MTAPGRFLVCIALLLVGVSSLRAQDDALQIGSIVEGELLPGGTQRYTLTALAQSLISFRVEALSDALDPRLEIFDRSGRLVIANDDYSYPETRDAALQAIVMPATSTYTIAVSAFAESSGAYRLHILPGYDVLAIRDREMQKTNWEVVSSDALVGQSESSLFDVDISGAGRSAVLLGLHLPLEKDLYFEAEFQAVRSANVWQVGLVFRYLAPDRYHRVLLNKNGFWQLERVRAETATVIRPWATHPAIVPGANDFRLGVLVSGQHFDVVFNGQVVGSAADNAPAQTGGVGLAVRTDEVYGGTVSFAVRETLVTVPTRAGDSVLFPQRLLTRRYYAIATDLARQQLAPVDGEIKIHLPESSVRRLRSGVSRVPVASDLRFEQFAVGAAVTVAVPVDAAGGCGIYFHYNDEEHYTLAYLTGAGDAGVSRRSTSGFEAGIYSKRPAPTGAAQYLLALVTDTVIHLYLDEQHVGSMDHQPRIGSIGIAAVNYEDVDTACSFADLWLLSFDG